MARRRWTVLSLAVIVCAASGTLWADQGDQKIRFGLFYSIPTGDLKLDLDPNLSGLETIEAKEALGFMVGYEYLVTDLFGLAPSYQFATHDIDAKAAGIEVEIAEIDYRALMVDLNFHVLRGDQADLYFAPTLGYLMWGDIEAADGGGPGTNPGFAYGGTVGVDVSFGQDSAWAFAAAASYVVASVDIDEPGVDDFDVDPVIVRVGVAYGF